MSSKTKLSNLETQLGIDFSDKNLPDNVKEYIEKEIMPRKGKIYWSESQKHIEKITELLNEVKKVKETKAEKELREYSNILKSLPSWKNMTTDEQNKSLDSLNMYLLNKKDFDQLKPKALEVFEKPPPPPKPKKTAVYNIPRTVIDSLGLGDLYSHLPGDTLEFSHTEMEKIKKMSNKGFNPKTNEFTLTKKDKEDIDTYLGYYNLNMANHNWPLAENYKNKIITLNPAVKDSLDANFEKGKKDNEPTFYNFWNIFK